MKSDAATVEEYISELSEERREAVTTVREMVLANLPSGYEEVMDFGMIAYVVPLSVCPKTYNGHPLMYAAIASEKNYVSVHLMNIYANQDTQRWFVESYKATGKRMNMGKSCVRFRKLEDLPLDLIGEAVGRTSMKDWVAVYEALRRPLVGGRERARGGKLGGKSRKAPEKVVLLSGGNPQIPKGDGDAPVQAYIAAMSGWKSDVGKSLDELIVRAVPKVRKAVRWNSPWYGVEGMGWFVSYHVFSRYVRVTFLNGASLRPVPPGSGKDKDARWVDIYEGELDERQMGKWVRQAAAIPGWDGF